MQSKQRGFRIIQNKTSLSPHRSLLTNNSNDVTTHSSQLFKSRSNNLIKLVVSPQHKTQSMDFNTLVKQQRSVPNALAGTNYISKSLGNMVAQYQQQMTKQLDDANLQVVVHIANSIIRFTFPPKYTTTQIRNQLKSKIKSQIVQFTTLDKNYQLDYLLTLEDESLEFLQNSPLELCPYIYTLEQPGTQLGLKDFQIIRCIGAGGFSTVYLSKLKYSGQFYAMKLVNKDFIIQNRKQDLLLNERDIMAVIRHPFTVPLQYAFESKHFLVFVLEFCSGGELFYQLRQLKKFSEQQAQFYMAEICLGMLYLHSMGIVYRDIKPENILIDHQGHVRIADFGLSKIQGQDEFAYSFCGSPEYMAPEMLLKTGHNVQVDHYCLGALLYELVTGLPPFYSRNTQKIYDSILHEEVHYPSHLSADIKDLMNGLLHKSPSKRLGCGNGLMDVLKHRWFSSINFTDILLKKVTPPIKPDPSKLNFEIKNQSEREVQLREQMKSSTKNSQLMYKEFYYDGQCTMYKQDQDKWLKEHRVMVDELSRNKQQSSKFKVSQRIQQQISLKLRTDGCLMSSDRKQ